MLRRGEVISVAGPVTVRLSGETTDVNVLWKTKALSLTTGDQVVVVKFGRQWVILNIIEVIP